MSLTVIFILAGMTAFAGANAAVESVYERYCGAWVCDDFILDFQYEAGEMTGKLTRYEESGNIVVWDFYHCQYETDSDILWCNGCTHYRSHLDMDTLEMKEEDWWQTDLSGIHFAFGDDEDMLIGYEIEDTGKPLVFQREKEAMAKGTQAGY